VKSRIVICGLLAVAGAGSGREVLFAQETQQIQIAGTAQEQASVLDVPDATRRQVEGMERSLRGAIDSAAAQLNKRLAEAIPTLQIQLSFQALPIVNGVLMPEGDANFYVLIPAIEQTGVKIAMLQNDPSRRVALPPGVRPMTNPNEEYTALVYVALIDAVLDQGMQLRLAPDRKLQLVAGELVPAPSPFIPRSRTLILQISGADLIALRDNRISRDDAKGRIKEFRY